MNNQVVEIDGIHINVYSLNTVIVGTGCAGFNAADSLYSLGQQDIAIITEGRKMGTSRNTGSDKQTYYKLTMAGDAKDSILEMAQTLFNGGCMHGDIALIEAALSTRNFFKLVELGVPFPHNEYGEYVGYKTDHDPRQRATSAGPLTSRYMVESLEKRVIERGIKIFDGYLVIGILTSDAIEGTENHRDSDSGNVTSEEKNAIGLITINLNGLNFKNSGITLFNCKNIIYATGGPAGIYSTSVYPESQTGASGVAFEAGVKGVNLTESQYGIASTKFRWNLSGTYQQVLPRYVSTDINGEDEKEFLHEYFPNHGKMLDAIFLKGYQWPFDPKKIAHFGSSLIDILVYNETNIKGRRVFLDYTKNLFCGIRQHNHYEMQNDYSTSKQELDFSLLGSEAYTYLQNSGALFGTPIQRLEKMNKPAITLYKDNGIDLYKDYLEIAVCYQHNNGGLAGNIWWESNIKHFFPVGEVNGTFGVYRPGGTALNSTQTGSLRAAQYISNNYEGQSLSVEDFIEASKIQLKSKVEIIKKILINSFFDSESKYIIHPQSNVFKIRNRMQKRMNDCGAHIRPYGEVVKAIHETEVELRMMVDFSRISSLSELPEVFRNIDIAITQYVYLNAIKEYIEKGGKSRGSYLIYDDKGNLPAGNLPEIFRFLLNNDEKLQRVVNELEIKETYDLLKKENIRISSEWKPVRPIPQDEYWFENIWREFRGKLM